MNRTPIRWIFAAAVGGVAVLLSTGCRDLGAGGTGEYRVPRERYRNIKGFEPDSMPSLGPATTQPLTLQSPQAATQPAEIEVTLAEVRQWALHNNLELKVDLLDPTISRTSINEEQARFEAIFTADGRYVAQDTPFLSQQGDNLVIRGSQVSSFAITPGLTVPLITGGQITAEAPASSSRAAAGRIDTTTGLPTSSEERNADAVFSFSQPLLRGAGFTRNLAPIRVAYYQYQEAEARTKRRVITVLSDAERQYWRLDAALKLLRVQKDRYDSSADQLRRSRRLLDVGSGVQADVIQSEAAVADAVSQIVAAESAVRNELRELKRIINQPGIELESPVMLRPASEPRFLAVRLDAHALADQAVRDRMEMLEAELRILQQRENVKIARNDLLPLLSINYRYGVSGLGETFGDAYDLLGDNRFTDHSVGVSVEVPLGNAAARARLRRAIASRLQQLADRNLSEQLVRNEVYASVQSLEQSWQGILAARQSVYAETRVLESETRKFERGETDSEAVRLARDRLALARQREVESVRDYQISQIDVAAATGSLLGLAEVVWTPIDPASKSRVEDAPIDGAVAPNESR